LSAWRNTFVIQTSDHGSGHSSRLQQVHKPDSPTLAPTYLLAVPPLFIQPLRARPHTSPPPPRLPSHPYHQPPRPLYPPLHLPHPHLTHRTPLGPLHAPPLRLARVESAPDCADGRGEGDVWIWVGRWFFDKYLWGCVGWYGYLLFLGV
ncbi:hypothetical protein K458DRAFT_430779, partial [Lentithecium fluviatile CBS 122367]